MPSSFTTRTFTRPSLAGTMAGWGRGGGLSVPERNLARGGESLASLGVRPGARAG